MLQNLEIFQVTTKSLTVRARLLVLTGFLLLGFGCKSIPEDVSFDEHLADLMNNRKYDEVLRTLSQLPKGDQSKPDYIFLRAEALYGKAGFDMVSLTKVATMALDFQGVEKSLVRLLKTDPVTQQTGSTDLSKRQINFVQSLVSFASYMKIIQSVPQITDQSRPLLMESILTLQKIEPEAQKTYRKAKTQSLMIHSVIVLSSVKKALRPGTKPEDGQDLFCELDGSMVAAELSWIAEHLSGALEDAEIVQKLSNATSKQTGKLAALRKSVDEFRANPQQSAPNTISSSILSAQGTVCAL